MADAMSVEELFSQLNGIITSEDPNNEEALGVVNQSLPLPRILPRPASENPPEDNPPDSAPAACARTLPESELTPIPRQSLPRNRRIWMPSHARLSAW
jgi:hypothetical protein